MLSEVRWKTDTELLKLFGAAKSVDVGRGLEPRVRQMAQAILSRIGDESAVEEGIGVLWYPSARSYARPGWQWLTSISPWAILTQLRAPSSNTSRERLTTPLQRRLAEVRRVQRDALGELHARVELAESPEAEYADASHAANLLNGQLRSGVLRLDGDEKQVLANRVRRLLEAGIPSATATDLSRLAWVCIHLQDAEGAATYAKLGFQRDPENEYCQALLTRLKIRP